MATRARGSRSRNQGYQSLQPTRVPRSAFDLSYSHKFTAEPSVLIPAYLQEVMPGDTISCRPSFLARMTSNVFPYMDGITLEYQFFFCPTRLVWDNWAKMHGERVDPDDHNDYTVPQIVAPAGGWLENTMADYFGVPTRVDNLSVSALPFRAAALCWNEWYRDQNLQDSLVIPTDDGPDLASEEHTLLTTRGKRKDRFAGALPFAQKGEAVSLPLGTTAPVVGDGTDITMTRTGTADGPFSLISLPSSGLSVAGTWTGATPIRYGNTGLQADLTNATAATINEIRLAVSLQHMFERDARGGTRYSEQILSHFGVQMPDVRYRPELLSVGSVPVVPIEVAQTSETLTGTPQGNVAAYAKGSGVSRGFTKSIDEWGFIIGFINLRSEVSYSQGIPAQLLRKTRVDHYVPDLALIGEESIPVAEIYCDGTGWTSPEDQTGDWQPWGFTPRYESYRHRVNQIGGEMRSNIPGDQNRLDQWHFGIDFQSRPALDDAFIEDDPNPILRNVAAGLVPTFLVDCYWKVTGVRPMPKIATPGLVRF